MGSESAAQEGSGSPGWWRRPVKLRPRSVAAFLLVGLGIFGAAYYLKHAPFYRGKPIDFWFDWATWGTGHNEPGIEAIRALGPKAVGYLETKARRSQSSNGLWQQASASVPKRIRRFLPGKSPSPAAELRNQEIAILLLGDIGAASARALPTLREQLSNPDRGITDAASLAIWRIEGTQEGFVRMLKSTLGLNQLSENDWRAARRQAAEDSHREAFRVLREMLTDGNFGVRSRGVYVAEKLGVPDADILRLLESIAASDPSRAVKSQATTALDSLKDEGKLPAR